MVDSMSDLISRCDVLSYILYIQNSGLGKKKALEYIYKYVENAISAYNVDKVVAELEEKLSKKHRLFLREDRDEIRYFYEMQILKEAIEIVRKGGVE